MATNKERREVARRIREKGSISYYSDVYKLVMGKKVPLETSAREDDEALAERLADLIEPAPKCSEVAPKCDREALLELANDLAYAGENVDNVACVDQTFIDSARRIREALGVTGNAQLG